METDKKGVSHILTTAYIAMGIEEIFPIGVIIFNLRRVGVACTTVLAAPIRFLFVR